MDRWKTPGLPATSASPIDPRNVAAFYNLGQIADMAGKPDEAAIAYGRALELNPQLAAAMVPLALALQKLGRDDDAIAVYDRVPAGDKSEFIAQFNRGLLQQGRGHLLEAESAFSRASEIDPADPKPRFQLGGVFYALGRFDEAIDCYRQLLLRKTDTAGVHGNLAKALWAKGDAAGALAACDDGLRQRPGDTAVIAFKAAMLLENGDTAAARALVDFDRLMKPIRIPPPPGFNDIPEFNKAISQYALTHPTLVFEPRNHATKSGRHTGELMLKPGGPVPAFASAVAAARSAVLCRTCPSIRPIHSLPSGRLAGACPPGRSSWKGRAIRRRTSIRRPGSAASTTPACRRTWRLRIRSRRDGSNSASRCRITVSPRSRNCG